MHDALWLAGKTAVDEDWMETLRKHTSYCSACWTSSRIDFVDLQPSNDFRIRLPSSKLSGESGKVGRDPVVCPPSARRYIYMYDTHGSSCLLAISSLYHICIFVSTPIINTHHEYQRTKTRQGLQCPLYRRQGHPPTLRQCKSYANGAKAP
jgi:hypothetical protein